MHVPALTAAAARAARHADAGEFDLARHAWLDALALAPGSAQLMLELSYLESLVDDYRAARGWALRAARTGPASLEDAIALVRRLRTFNEGRVLDVFCRGLLASGKANPALLAECASHLSNLNLPATALRCADAAVAAAPGSTHARLLRGQLLANHGRVADADVDFDWVLAREPQNLQALWLACRLHKQVPGRNVVALLRRALASPTLDAHQQAVGWRAMHKALDDLGDHEAAWAALERMCAARRATEPHDPAESSRLVDALINIDWSVRPPVPVLASPAATPIFIVGMYRSGTTLVEQLLGGNPEVAALGELLDFPAAIRHAANHHFRGALDLEAIGRCDPARWGEIGSRYAESLAWRAGPCTAFTDKLPANLFNVGYICSAMPQARVIHMVRDPLDTCFSNLRELFTDVNRYSYDQRSLADHFLQSRRLMAHWHRVFPGRIMDVSYERLVADPVGTMREVAAFCGVPYVDGMADTGSSSRAVSTASSVQVRAPVHVARSPSWLPYLARLEPLVALLEEGGAPIHPLARAV